MTAGAEARDRYHHGNLRRALIDASLELIAEQGAAMLTLREVARRAGVTHAAPYRHFADKSALLAAVAAEGFRALVARVAHDTGGIADPRERLLRSGCAYVLFAVEHPAHFRVMFGADLAAAADPERCRASGEAYQQLLDAITACQRVRAVRRGDPQLLATAAWSFTHGLASLLVDSQLPAPPDPPAFVATAVRIFHEGLAPRPRGPAPEPRRSRPSRRAQRPAGRAR